MILISIGNRLGYAQTAEPAGMDWVPAGAYRQGRERVTGGDLMSLTVSPDLVEQARAGEVDDARFIDCIRTSLPYAWQVISGLIGDLHAGDAAFADNTVPPPG